MEEEAWDVIKTYKNFIGALKRTEAPKLFARGFRHGVRAGWTNANYLRRRWSSPSMNNKPTTASDAVDGSGTTTAGSVQMRTSMSL